jgi:DNA-binding NarL/FixJ family response regulator
VESGVATRALAESPERLGYLLKDRVGDIEDFVGTLRRVANGGSALDPLVVSRLLAAGDDDGPLQPLTPREREVLQLVAEGLSNRAVAERLGITLGSTEKYVSGIFTKLGLPDTGGEYRRVLAVLRFLQS